MKQTQRSVVSFKERRRQVKPPLSRSSTVLAFGVILVVFSLVIMAHSEELEEKVETDAYRKWASQPVPVGEPPYRWQTRITIIYPYTIVGAVVFLFGLATLVIWYAMYRMEGRYEGDGERESLLGKALFVSRFLNLI